MKRLIPRLVAALLTFTIGVAAAMIWINHHPAPSVDGQVVGQWITDPDDIESLHKHGRVNLEFSVDGRCNFKRFPAWIYHTPILSGRVQEGTIIVDYPASIKGRVEYTVEPAGKLRLRFGSFDSTYIREHRGER